MDLRDDVAEDLEGGGGDQDLIARSRVPQRQEHPDARVRVEVRVASEARDGGPRQVEREAVRRALLVDVAGEIALGDRQVDRETRDLDAVAGRDRREWVARRGRGWSASVRRDRCRRRADRVGRPRDGRRRDAWWRGDRRSDADEDGADDDERAAGGQRKRPFPYAIVRTHNACRARGWSTPLAARPPRHAAAMRASPRSCSRRDPISPT